MKVKGGESNSMKKNCKKLKKIKTPKIKNKNDKESKLILNYFKKVEDRKKEKSLPLQSDAIEAILPPKLVSLNSTDVLPPILLAKKSLPRPYIESTNDRASTEMGENEHEQETRLHKQFEKG